ncbi:SGNH/GDSL hydrolase family protein [Weissella paramesenteroides]|uniref:SGNH/GDSL hydrolase family protein n=1 Tax=Weissella paramesenteroides TaxID=1249 RepID=UPI00103E281D|nr:SGNH/GDSL hydrolase family protein [Weissella paramesenteroides]RZQ58365.1 hypothetical protein EWR19_04550 [Weissella paramesenteroides]
MSVFKSKNLLLTLLIFLGVTFVYGQSVNATTILQPQESESVTKSIAGTTVTGSNVTTEQPTEVQPDANTFYHDKSIWVIGDSLAVGWDGQRNVAKNYPTLVGEKLKPRVLQASYASSGSQISGNQNGTPTYDMSNNVQRVINDQQFSDANILIIELGVNDLNYSSNNLGYVQQRLQSNIKKLRKANPKIKIFGILPFASYQQNKASQYSMNDLQDALTKVYSSFGIPVLNWENTHVAHESADLGDHLVHPTQATYEKMANTISDWLLEDSNLNVTEHDSTVNFVSNGWQVDEQGERQYAENNTLVTGFKNINGKTYYFDPKTKGLLKNQFITSDGQRYYVDTDGSVIKGPATNGTDIQIINGKAYEINHLGKITLSTKTGYLSTNQGWIWLEHGELFTGFRYYMGTYYWFENGIRINNAWRSAWNYQYYVDSQGRAVQGKAYLINNVFYNFGDNGTFYLRGKSTGYLGTSVGWRWIENGQLYTGFRKYMGAFYYFENGVRQENKWVSEWGHQYFVGKDGRSVEGTNVNINGKKYNFGNNHTFYLR